MDPVFTLQWSEFVVAQKLQQLLRKKDKSFSVFVPLSRQEKGVDLVVYQRNKNGETKTFTVQIKASRARMQEPPKRKNILRYSFGSWFNRFTVPDRADFVVLTCLYAPDPSRTRRVSSKWYKDCSLIFTREEMKKFMVNCKMVSGKPDRMFGFGFNSDLRKIILTRGDKKRSGRNYSDHLLEKRITDNLIVTGPL